MNKTNLNQNSEKQPSNPLNTEQLTTDLRPPKKPAEKAFGKYFRKVEVDYNNFLGYRATTLNIDGRYVSMMMMGSFKDMHHWANGAMAMTLVFAIFVPQLTWGLSHGVWTIFTPAYDVFVQILLTLYALREFKKSKKKQVQAVVCDRKTGNVRFPAFGKNPELVIPFDQVELYVGSVGYSLGSGMAAKCIVPTMYPKAAKWDFQYAVLVADNYDQACRYWTLLTEFMDKNKPIPYGFLNAVQFNIDDDSSAIWEGTDIEKRYPLDPEIKDNYRYVYHSDFEGTVDYPIEEVAEVVAPFSDDPELLAKNVERAHQLNLIL
ncbi:hypothetical protein DXX93_15230 [Thalassotalea euphylliae]|uniref:Uncharacterized protein n=1 Tax=Thalassotalea euphylliae TaxID=1655234 RepID=A0A3E0TTU4_9GAMM|nr:hypothetical protein [Thalassotalea euphylliae]REL27777.1 hypothetical protein DXX93_15230 [Thalassotalea euphylliae]